MKTDFKDEDLVKLLGKEIQRRERMAIKRDDGELVDGLMKREILMLKKISAEIVEPKNKQTGIKWGPDAKKGFSLRLYLSADDLTQIGKMVSDDDEKLITELMAKNTAASILQAMVFNFNYIGKILHERTKSFMRDVESQIGLPH